MKKYGIIAAAWFLFMPAVGAAASIEAASAISAITVFPDAARITRTATVSLPAGESRILIGNLPLGLDEASIRVSGESPERVTLGSVQLEQAIAADVVQEREKRLRGEIDDWKRKRQEVLDAKTRSMQQIEFIRATGGLGKSKDSKPPAETANARDAPLPLEQWQQAWQTLEAATAQAQEKIREADKSLVDFDKGIAQLEGQLEQIATGDTRFRTASLNVNAAKPTTLALNLRYQIGNAGWMPVYDAELDTNSGELQIKTQAEIRQSTGEDWKDAAVTLSTLRPTGNTSLPELDSWVIDFAPDVAVYKQSLAARAPMTRNMEAADMAAGMVAAEAPSPAPAPQPLVMQNSALLSGDYNAEYRVPGVLTLASGDETRRVTLESHKLESELVLSSVPRLDPRALLTSKATYTGDAPLLPGPVALYRDGNFVGNTDLSLLQSKEELRLSFGEDDKVKINFQPTPEKTGQNGLLSTRETRERHYTISMENHHADKRTLVLYDSIPVAANEDIRVNLDGDRPDEQDVDGKKGVVRWERKLPASEKVTLEYGYSVIYPQDKTLSGM